MRLPAWCSTKATVAPRPPNPLIWVRGHCGAGLPRCNWNVEAVRRLPRRSRQSSRRSKSFRPLSTGEAGEKSLKGGHCALDGRVKRWQSSTLFSCCAPCSELPRSRYYVHLARRHRIDMRRVSLCSRVNALFSQSCRSAGSRGIVAMLREEGIEVVHFKVRGLMKEQELISKQPDSRAYKKARLNALTLPMSWIGSSPRQLRSGADITYIWTQGRWSYLAVVLNLCSRRVVCWAMSAKPDADLAIKTLDRAYEIRGRPHGVLFYSAQGR